MNIKVNGKQIVFVIWEVIAGIVAFLVTHSEQQGFVMQASSLVFKWLFLFGSLTLVGFLPIGLYWLLEEVKSEAGGT